MLNAFETCVLAARRLPLVWAAMAVWALLCAAGQGRALAAPRAVEPFSAGSWAALQRPVQQTTAVVFTSTDCSHCPDVIAQLARDSGGRAPLWVVVMDVAPGEDDAALLRHLPYQRVSRLFAFDGPADALRYSINPDWPGVTPYVAWLSPGQPPRFVMGLPTLAERVAWRSAAMRAQRPDHPASGASR